MISTDENGKLLVVLPQVIFEGKRSISWDDVETYLLRYVGDIVKIAENGWYRYDTRFAMPVMNGNGEFVRYNVYRAVLIVRYAADNKLYLYDIQNIKKETSIPS